mmetsp:Transcript_42302/g.105301  ORF Transcript_42302/g.105301 Transcript_42302/m.105301 type:complete len:236 (-) Transcript_42302:912-1619(-)
MLHSVGHGCCCSYNPTGARGLEWRASNRGCSPSITASVNDAGHRHQPRSLSTVVRLAVHHLALAECTRRRRRTAGRGHATRTARRAAAAISAHVTLQQLDARIVARVAPRAEAAPPPAHHALDGEVGVRDGERRAEPRKCRLAVGIQGKRRGTMRQEASHNLWLVALRRHVKRAHARDGLIGQAGSGAALKQCRSARGVARLARNEEQRPLAHEAGVQRDADQRQVGERRRAIRP